MNVDEVLAKMDTLDTNEEEIQYIIDENLRVISIPPLGVVLGVEGDKDVNSAKFKMVRYYKGIDLSKFEIRINFANANGDLSYYTVKNPTVTDDTLTFEWLVGYLVTKYKGTVRFVVRMITTDASTGEVQQAFDTTVGEARSLEGLLVDTPTDEKVYDIVAQLKADLTDHVNNLIETIPADYSELTKKVEDNTSGISELKEDLGDFNGLGSFNDISKTLEFGYVNKLGQYASTIGKQNMFMPLVHCVPGYKFIFTNPLDMDAWLSIHLYSTELLYKGKISEVLCEKEKTVSYTVEEECFIRASVNKRYATASTDEELAEVQNNFYVCNVEWLPIPVEKYNDSLKIGINTLAYYRMLVERKSGDFIFCYQTDTHYSQSGTYKTLDNLKNLVNIDHSIKPNFCSNLGDVTHGYLNRATGMDDYMKAMSVYKAIKMFLPVQGNHENNTLYTFQHTQNRSIKEIIQKNWFFNSVFVPFCIKNNGVIDKDKLYYSVDFDKVKVIVLDTNDLPETEVNSSGQLIFASGYQAGIRQEQLDWLIDTLKMPNPKPVVILSHHSLSAGASQDANTVYNANAVRGILEAYNTSGTFTLEQNPYGGEYFKISVNCDFTGAKEYKGANVIGCFAGHTHADAMYTINNIHYVVSDSSVPDTSENKEARKSDATSDVIETVKIDTGKKEVNIIRFGYGIAVKDRSFTY